MSLKDTVGRALEALRRNAAAGGSVAAFVDSSGRAIAFQGDSLAPYVDPIITVGQEVLYRATSALAATYDDLADIDVEDWTTIVFGFRYTSAGAAGQFAVIAEWKTQAGIYIPFGVLDGTLAAFAPNGLANTYASRVAYASAIKSTPSIAGNELVAWSIPYETAYYKTIRLRVAELSAANGTLQVVYSLAR